MSQCWGWRGAQSFSHPLEWPGAGTGSAQGSASIRFLFVSQMNHSQQLWPCLTVLLMCFLLAGKTRQAAPAPGACLVAVGENLGNLTGLSPCTQVLGVGVDTPHRFTGVPLMPLPHNFLLHSAFQMQLLGVFCSQIDSHTHTQLFLKSQTLCLAEPAFQGVF